MSRVMDVLAQKELYSVEPDQTATEVAHRMAELHVGAILVMQAGELKGIFSERDLLTRVAGQVDRREDRGPQHIAQPLTDSLKQV